MATHECPHCGQAFTAPGPGTYDCPHCNVPSEVADLPPAVPFPDSEGATQPTAQHYGRTPGRGGQSKPDLDRIAASLMPPPKMRKGEPASPKPINARKGLRLDNILSMLALLAALPVAILGHVAGTIWLVGVALALLVSRGSKE